MGEVMQEHRRAHPQMARMDGSHCARCGGLLRVERVRRSRLWLHACMACGDRTDETILANRRCMAADGAHRWKAALWERIRLLAALEGVA